VTISRTYLSSVSDGVSFDGKVIQLAVLVREQNMLLKGQNKQK
jgi:hypothetical protein